MQQISLDAPPLDYSFRELKKLEDLIKLVPRGKKEKRNLDKPNDNPKESIQEPDQQVVPEMKEQQEESGKQEEQQIEEKQEDKSKKVEQKFSPDQLIPQNNAASLLITQQNIPLSGKIVGGKLQENKNQNQIQKMKVKLLCTILILCQNKFTSIANFYNIMDTVFGKLKETITDTIEYKLQNIRWIDLSYNLLTNLDYDFKQMPALQTLYIHCNLIKDINEFNKLSDHPSIKSLTIHGNPFEMKVKNQETINTAIWRIKIIQMIPHIVRIDSVLVSKKVKNYNIKLQLQERDNARVSIISKK